MWVDVRVQVDVHECVEWWVCICVCACVCVGAVSHFFNMDSVAKKCVGRATCVCVRVCVCV